MGKKNIQSWKKFFFLLLFLIFILIILLSFTEIKEITKLITEVNYSLFILAVIVQFASFAIIAGLYKVILESGISYLHLFKTSIAMVFIDQAIPSFSASGNVLLYYATRKKKVRKEKAAFLIAMNVFLNFLFFFIIFIFGLTYLILFNKLFSKWVWIWAFLGIAILFVLLSRILWTKRGERHFKTFLSWLTKKIPRFQKKILRLVSDFYKGKKMVRASRFLLFLLFVFFSYVLKILVIFLVFLSLGYTINLGVLIIGYIIASVLSAISYIRIGAYEASMTLGYLMLGIPYNLALTGTLLYRAISFWIPFLIGFILFKTLFRENKRTKI